MRRPAPRVSWDFVRIRRHGIDDGAVEDVNPFRCLIGRMRCQHHRIARANRGDCSRSQVWLVFQREFASLWSEFAAEKCAGPLTSIGTHGSSRKTAANRVTRQPMR